MSSHEPKKSPSLLRNDRKWESMKGDIHRIYLTEKKTLPATMMMIENIYGFRASLRKWKLKLNEWKFDKNLTEEAMKIVVAKAEKRAREGKETVFYHGDTQIMTAKIENFKRRKITKESGAASPSAETPGPVTYHTPHTGNDDSVTAHPLEQTSEQSQDLESYRPMDASRERSLITNFDQTPIFDPTQMTNSSSSMSLSNSTSDFEVSPYVATFEQNLSVVETDRVPGPISTLQTETILPKSPANNSNLVQSLGGFQPPTSFRNSVLADNFVVPGIDDELIDLDGATPEVVNRAAFIDRRNDIGIRITPQRRIITRTPPAVMPSPTLGQTTTFDLETWNNYFDFGMDADIGFNFDDFPQLLSQTISTHLPGISTYSGNVSPGNFYQHGSMLGIGFDAALFQPFGKELFPYANLKYKVVENLPWFQLQKLIDQPGFLSTSVVVDNIFCSSGSPSRISANLSGAFSIDQTHLALDERHNVVSGFLNSRFNEELGSPVIKLTTHLLQLIPERKIGELQMKAQQLFDPSNKLPAFQLFEVALYFSSNNLLSEDQTDTFLKWIIEKKYGELLKSFLQHKIPTLCTFASRILESAVRIVEPEFLSLLLRSSIDSRVLSGRNGGILLRNVINAAWINEEDGDPARYSELAKILLKSGADPNPQRDNDEDGTPLFYAALWGSVEIVELLAESGADINAKSYQGWGGDTALAVAAEWHGIPLVLTLLELGAKVDISHIDELSILEWTAIKSPRLYNILLGKSKKLLERFHVPGILYASKGGPSSLSSYLKQSDGLQKLQIQEMLECSLSKAIHCAPKDCRLLEVLLGVGVDANIPTIGSSSLLENALYLGSLETVNVLLKAGADVITRGALRAASLEFDYLELLIDHGADLRTYGGDALQKASDNCKFECVALLIESGVDINTRASEAGNPTALQAAARKGDIKLVQFLVDRGADVNAPAGLNRGRTALQEAAYYGQFDMVHYLLDVGADVNAAPAKIKGWTALEAAARSRGPQHEKNRIFKLLLDKGALINRPLREMRGQTTTSALHALIDGGQDESTRLAVTAGADVNLMTFGKEGRTPLQLAAEKGQLEIVRLLLEHGAQVNSPPANNYGRTVLQAAASCEAPTLDLVQFLLDQGADVNAEAAMVGGITALQGAAIRGHVKVALMLLGANANVNALPAIKEGRTVVEGAAEHGRLDMVQLLVDAGAVGDAGTGLEKAIKAAERNNHFTIADMLKERQVAMGISSMD